jgi:hypothetical protein
MLLFGLLINLFSINIEKSYNDKFEFVRVPAETVVVVPSNVTVVLPRTANTAQSPRIMLILAVDGD